MLSFASAVILALALVIITVAIHAHCTTFCSPLEGSGPGAGCLRSTHLQLVRLDAAHVLRGRKQNAAARANAPGLRLLQSRPAPRASRWRPAHVQRRECDGLRRHGRGSGSVVQRTIDIIDMRHGRGLKRPAAALGVLPRVPEA